jgi:two-component system, NtrC family, sensor kinase
MTKSPTASRPPRVLVIDDTPAVHEDFRKIFGVKTPEQSRLEEAESAVFGPPGATAQSVGFRIDSAFQGQDALELVRKALEENDPYVLAFVDVRMPPGWDGIETIEHIWKCCPELQAVICTAYSDYSWNDITRRLGHTDNLLILKKPFETIEVLQIAHALTQKWILGRQAKLRMDDLDRMVHERTAELRASEAELRQAQKMEVIGRMAAGIAHEFNNVLTVIQGDVGLLHSASLSDSERRNLLDQIMQASQRAASVTRQLLAFSRKQVLQPRLLNLSAVVQQTREMLARLVEEKHKIQFRCSEELLAILGDENGIQQILVNLVLNARDAMPDEGIIEIATELAVLDEAAAAANSNARPGRFACLSVADHGQGMTPDVLARIFDPFFTTKDVGKGTGLGLTIIHGIVKQHEGWIAVTSEVGQGSTFKIFLPVADATSRPAASEKMEPFAAIGPGAIETVLVAKEKNRNARNGSASVLANETSRH